MGHKMAWKSSETNEEFLILVHDTMPLKWRKDRSIPLTEVVEGFEIFQTEGKGHNGRTYRPNHDLLKNSFGTSNETEMIERILLEGELLGDFHESHSKKEKKGTHDRTSK
eukprot:TRINITY_DN684_c0_g1_i2.p1 TRINITY_DN684_c0_g1~~TRINITY_DN684_c0_g1_i2.p1  ORF type:complete len:110 (-),score=21.52 TRINITY_DN684_c0_g1_i2:199-528(-)